VRYFIVPCFLALSLAMTGSADARPRLFGGACANGQCSVSLAAPPKPEASTEAHAGPVARSVGLAGKALRAPAKAAKFIASHRPHVLRRNRGC